MHAASNETIGFAVRIQIGEIPLGNPRFQKTPLRTARGEIEASNLSIFRMIPIHVDRWPAWHIRAVNHGRRNPAPLDVLLPLHAEGDLGDAIPANSTLYFWIDLTIPKETPAGSYTSEIELTATHGFKLPIPIRLTVWPFTLPDSGLVTAITDLKLLSPSVEQQSASERDRMVASSFDLLEQHRILPTLPDLMPKVDWGTDGKLRVDWTEYDAWVRPILQRRLNSGPVPKYVWPIPTSVVAADRPSGSSTKDGRQSQKFRTAYLEDCVRHFEEAGWLERSYAWVPASDRAMAERSAASREFAGWMRALQPRVAIAAKLMPDNLELLGWFGFPDVPLRQAVDIWCPPAQFFDLESMTEERKASRTTWVSADRPPFSGSLSIAAPSTDVRALAWQAQWLGAETLHLGATTGGIRATAAEGVDSVAPAGGGGGAAAQSGDDLLYWGGGLGRKELLPSLRLKLLRAGFTDAAYGRLLRDVGREHIRKALVQSLVSYAGAAATRTSFADGRPTGWVQDWNLYETARRIMADEIMFGKGSTEENEGPSDSAWSNQVHWRALMTSARRRHMLLDGTRVRFRGDAQATEFLLEAHLTLRNGERLAWEPRIQFEFPSVWSEQESALLTVLVPPNEFRRAALTARTAGFPLTKDAKSSCTIRAEDSDGPSLAIPLRIPLLLASPQRNVIKIDGDLGDWPPGKSNVADGFKTITTDGLDSDRRPSFPTVAFVIRGVQDLFIAVNCSSPGPTPRLPSSRKTVTYEDLIPVGEELVDILFDPYNAGTRLPSDLYHLVIKRDGPPSAEKGLNCDPPVGQRGPWLVDFDYATSIQNDRWIAEVRVPLAAFPPEIPTRQIIWGFNVARFDGHSQEFSTWSGAVGNAYDPLSLGNLLLP